MAQAPHISVVAPLYRTAGCIEELYKRLCEAISPITEEFEIVLVNDGSPDDDWSEVEKLAKQDRRVKGIDLSRNFGQHYALSAGIDYAKGDWVVVMDGDLEDNPADIPSLYEKANEGFEVVFARRLEKTHSVFKKFLSKCFTAVFSLLYGGRLDNSLANFSIISRKVADNFRSYKERNRAYGLFIMWLGFPCGYVDVIHGTRHHGKSSYSFMRQFILALEIITSQSNRPLEISVGAGLAMAGVSFAGIVVLFLRYFFFDKPLMGWTSLIVTIFFTSGLILINLGVLGLYLGKVFNETKGRPLYVVNKTLNIDAK